MMTKNVFQMDIGPYFPLNMVNDVLNLKILFNLSYVNHFKYL